MPVILVPVLWVGGAIVLLGGDGTSSDTWFTNGGCRALAIRKARLAPVYLMNAEIVVRKFSNATQWFRV